MANVNELHQPELVNGYTKQDYDGYTRDNKHAWDAMAEQWSNFHSQDNADGSDMFSQLLLPAVRELSGLPNDDGSLPRGVRQVKPGDRILDLGAGSGILARMFAKHGAHVTGTDYSEKMLDEGRKRAARDNLSGQIEYLFMDLTDYQMMESFMDDKERFDVITISTTIKSLENIEPLARALPLMLKPEGCCVIIDLHPAFSKPAGHRGMELKEDPATGYQKLETYIKIPQYLNIAPCKSEAVRGQPEPLWVHHRPMWSLFDVFFRNGLVLDAMREPAFKGEQNTSQAQNYHNFQQTPMLLGWRLRHASRT